MTAYPVRCSFAGCRDLGEFFEPHGRWHFCGKHYDIHLALRREERAQERARLGKPQAGRPPLRPCGTHAAYLRHKARGEYPCQPCVDAEREHQRERYARRKAS